MRAAGLGVFMGFILIDLAFDLESMAGDVSSSKPFYFARARHGVASRLILLGPLFLTLVLQLIACWRYRLPEDIFALVLNIAANCGGAYVLAKRKEMEAAAPEEVPSLLAAIGYAHVAMLPLALSAVLLAHRAELEVIRRSVTLNKQRKVS